MLWIHAPRYVRHRQCVTQTKNNATYDVKFRENCEKHYSEVLVRELRKTEISDLVEACIGSAIVACMNSYGYYMSPIDWCTETTTAGAKDFWCWSNDPQF